MVACGNVHALSRPTDVKSRSDGSAATSSIRFVEEHAALTPSHELRARLARFQRALRESAVEVALVVQNADLFYFSGTVQQSYLAVPVEGEPALFTRKTVARARLETALPVVPLGTVRRLPHLLRERYGVVPRRVGLELDVLPVNHLRRLEALFEGAEMVDVSPLIVGQRAVKSAYEIELIRAAGRVTIAAMERVPELLREGMTEAEFAGRVEAVARSLGHQGIIRMRGFNQEMFYGQLLAGASGVVSSFLDTPLAGTGLSPAVAQGVSFKRIGRGEPVVFDFVSVVDGYTADFTRVFSIGPLAHELVRAYDAALRIERAVVDVARPGVSCRALYERAVAVAEEEGLGSGFMGHGEGQVRFVGHGVGVELDELPVISPNGRALEEGMVFALEPKFVLPGVGAIGVENTWAVTGDGLTLLTDASEEIRYL